MSKLPNGKEYYVYRINDADETIFVELIYGGNMEQTQKVQTTKIFDKAHISKTFRSAFKLKRKVQRLTKNKWHIARLTFKGVL